MKLTTMAHSSHNSRMRAQNKQHNACVQGQRVNSFTTKYRAEGKNMLTVVTKPQQSRDKVYFAIDT